MSTHYHSNFLGFTSFGDLLAAVFANTKHYKKMNILCLSLILSLFAVTFIENWVWAPFWSLMIFTAVFVLDFILAIFVAKKSGDSFQTNKAVRFVLSLTVAWLILAVMHNLGRMSMEMGDGIVNERLFSTFATVCFFLWLLFNFASVIRHASALKLIPAPMAKFFIKQIDAYKGAISKTEIPVADKPEAKADNSNVSQTGEDI